MMVPDEKFRGITKVIIHVEGNMNIPNLMAIYPSISFLDNSHRATNARKNQGIIKVTRIHHLETMNVLTNILFNLTC